MVTNKKIKVVDDVIEVPAKKYITTDGMEFIDGNAADIHQAQLDLAEKAKLCFEKYGIYTTDDVLIEEDALNGNEEITKDDYLFTRVLHTDMIDIDEMYILQAKYEKAPYRRAEVVDFPSDTPIEEIDQKCKEWTKDGVGSWVLLCIA